VTAEAAPGPGGPGPGDVGGPLAGLRVIDLSRVLAGPYCGQLLGDHGAEVIKVEPPAGDDTRTWGPYMPDGRSAYYAAINRNKKNICLDLRTPAARQVLWRLIETADIVIENFKAGTMARWGLDYEHDLAPRFPRLVYCRISGFGLDGPLGGLAGYDAALQAYGGLMSVNGEPERDPMRIGVPVVDMVTGILASVGILLALQERHSSGRGQLVDSTLLDTAITLLHPHSGGWLNNGKLPVRTGAAHPSIAPYETFHTPGGLFFISAANDRQFAALADVLGRPELAADQRFTTNEARLANVAALRAVLSALICDRDPEALSQELARRGVAAAPVHDVAQALTAPQVRHRELVIDQDGYHGTASPVKLGRTPAAAPQPPVLQGADTRAVMTELGYDEAAIAALIAGTHQPWAAG
jgi:crotonobetainyl-CoA:carnitine CoA-transferase CaiB-like acyl-CoA transferase